MKKTLEINRDTLLIFLIVLIGILLRWYQLDSRPFHHDESLNSIYGLYPFFDISKIYKYDPMLHGPLLYNILPFFYDLFGVSEWTPRSFMAILGSLFIFFPLLLKKYLRSEIIIFFMAFIALSPSLTYWSRFVRHDPLVFFTYLCAFFMWLKAHRSWRPGIIILTFALHLCIKENIFVLFAQFLGFLIFLFLFAKFYHKEELDFFSGFRNQLKKFYGKTLLCLFLAILIFIYLYSAGFTYFQGPLDALYRKSFLYWLQQHGMERIKGPFSYHFWSLSWYEFPFILAMVAQFFHLSLKKESYFRIIGIVLLSFLFMGFSGIPVQSITHSSFGVFLKLKINFDIFLLMFLVGASFYVTIYHLMQKKYALAFWGYFFYSSFFTYSYLGEKVPWLSQYILWPGLIYFALYLQNISNSKRLSKYVFISAALVLIFCLRTNIVTNHNRAGEASQFISQVHTTHKFHSLMLELRHFLQDPLAANKRNVYMRGDAIWPGHWYLYGIDGYFHNIVPRSVKLKDSDYVFVSLKDSLNLSQSHTLRLIPLRAWWVPNYNDLTLKNYFLYALFHTPWNPTGSTKVKLWVKKSLNKE